MIGSLLVLGVLLLLVAVTNGLGALTRAGRGSPYDVISHVVLIAAAGLPALWAVGVTLRAMVLYWRDTHGPLRDLANLRAWALTLSQVARLSHQTGGAEGCSYENNEPSGARRIHHQLVLFGFLLTFLSTVSAGFIENVPRRPPPVRVRLGARPGRHDRGDHDHRRLCRSVAAQATRRREPDDRDHA